MEYEWDEQKRKQNLAKHGIDFNAVHQLDWGNAIGYQDRRRDYNEPRFVTYGKIADRLHVCVYAERGLLRRIISLRKANERERMFYEKATQTTH